jgi:Lon protease-like protein
MGDLDTPLFICTLSFPSMPTFLHIFEPRYRLMIRRAMESGERKFGMLLHNPTMSSQGDLGPVPFYQYGTLLHIISMQLLPDGRSLIETTGVSRFRVLRYGTLDGYTVGQIQRIDDISLTDEENLEASETSQSSHPHALSAAEHFGAPPYHGRPRRPPGVLDLDTTSTKDLMEIATRFVRTMQAQSAPWLQTRVLQVYGEFPNDPALFPWWFASILPIMDAEKYKLLETKSVRQRLKICVGWILRIEAQRW